MRRVIPVPEVRRLGDLFSPTGLPLVAKSPGAVPTASFVVRGGPGVGKTTLAIALGLAVASGAGGALLYLSTEVAPADARAKAADLGVEPERIAAVMDGRESHILLVDHLAADQEQGLDEPGQRTEAALRRVWNTVHAASAPIRVVVVDSFLFVGTHTEPTLRASAMDLLVALEARGVSAILVEEAPAPAADWLGFLVDVIFELEWATDPDVGSRYRRLGVPKSRFVEALPGPHDYSRRLGQLAVWPSLLSVTRDPQRIMVSESPPLLWGRGGDDILLVQPGSVVCDHHTQHPGSFVGLLEKLPWIRLDYWDVGGESPWEWGWDVVEGSRGAIHLIVGLEAMIGRERYRASIPDTSRALTALGATHVFPILGTVPPSAVPFSHVRGGRFRAGVMTPADYPLVAMLADIVGMPEVGTAEVRSLWAGSHAAAVDWCVQQLQSPGRTAPPLALLLMAALYGLHLRSSAATDWLLAHLDQPVLSRALALPGLHRQGRLDEARRVAAELPLDSVLAAHVAAALG